LGVFSVNLGAGPWDDRWRGLRGSIARLFLPAIDLLLPGSYIAIARSGEKEQAGYGKYHQHQSADTGRDPKLPAHALSVLLEEFRRKVDRLLHRGVGSTGRLTTLDGFRERRHGPPGADLPRTAELSQRLGQFGHAPESLLHTLGHGLQADGFQLRV